MPSDQAMTLNHCNAYTGGQLYISGHIYGEPSVRWYLNEERPNCDACIADSLNKDEIEALKQELTQ